jgi:hypothetical protein
MVYTLLGQITDTLGGRIDAIEIVPAPNGMAAGRLCIDGRTGPASLPIEIALGIGLAVVLDLPLRVSAQLVDEAPRFDSMPTLAVRKWRHIPENVVWSCTTACLTGNGRRRLSRPGAPRLHRRGAPGAAD